MVAHSSLEVKGYPLPLTLGGSGRGLHTFLFRWSNEVFGRQKGLSLHGGTWTNTQTPRFDLYGAGIKHAAPIGPFNHPNVRTMLSRCGWTID